MPPSPCSGLTSQPLVRRDVLRAGGSLLALAGATALPHAVLASTNPALTVGQSMLDRAKRVLSLLDEEQTERVQFAFASSRRERWNYMYGSRIPPGLTMETMSAPQKDAALDLLSTALSEDGFKTATNVMLQQDILRDEWGKGSPDRNRERFALSLFGTPSETKPWGWRWEGHHLTMTVTLVGTRVVSTTPKAFSSEPNTVPSGPSKGLVVLPENETLGRALHRAMGSKNRERAVVSDRSYGNITTTAGREERYGEPEGIALGDLPAAQADMVTRLIDVYTHDYLTVPLANEQRARLNELDMASVHFAWAGPNIEGQSFYYRIHGGDMLIEFATLRNQPEHQHTAVHDLRRNLGQHAL
ncbi:MAG: DUF3500 domain-containing protein [Pseudomonadota bacterium]